MSPGLTDDARGEDVSFDIKFQPELNYAAVGIESLAKWNGQVIQNS